MADPGQAPPPDILFHGYAFGAGLVDPFDVWMRRVRLGFFQGDEFGIRDLRD